MGVSKYSEENEQKNYNKIYGTYLNNLLATLVMIRGINKSTQVNVHLHCIGPLTITVSKNLI